MKVSTDTQVTLKTLEDSKKIAIVAGSGRTDVAAAAMALYHFLLNQGKEVSIVIPYELSERSKAMPGIESVEKDFGARNLIITLDTNDVAIDKVSYHSEPKKFQLVVHPVGRMFNVENIHYDYEGLAFDTIILIGVEKIGNLGSLYENNINDFSSTILINIDNHNGNEQWGQINIIDTDKPNTAELIFSLFSRWNVTPPKESAIALLAGMSEQNGQSA